MSKRGGLRTRTRVPRWARLEERYRRWRTVLLVGWALAATAWIALQQLGTSTGWKVAALVLGVLLPLLSTEARERLQRREARGARV
jgi:peptidoglycan/LPS O-acetylase OafA/YrhL